MQYNYPLSETSTSLIKDIMSAPTNGFFSSFDPSLAIILFILSCLIIVLLGLSILDGFIESLAGVVISLILIIISIIFAIGIYSSHISGGGQEQRFKQNLINATHDSWDNEENYKEFQSNIKRYLHSQDIELEDQCKGMNDSDNVLEIEDSNDPYNSTEDLFNIYVEVKDLDDPNNTIICDKDSKKLSGSVRFKNNNNQVVYYDYNTSVNDNHEYAIFTLNEKQEEK